MALFSRRDRIAIICITALILTGWGVRYALHRSEEPGELKVIRNAVEPPAELASWQKQSISPVNINTASLKELEMLPMIGPVRAEAIISYRQKNGPFNTISDITNVHGIGSATFEEIKSSITVNSETPYKNDKPSGTGER